MEKKEDIQEEMKLFMQEMTGNSNQNFEKLFDFVYKFCSDNNLEAVIAVGNFKNQVPLVKMREIYEDDIYGGLEYLILSLIKNRTIEAVKENTEEAFEVYENFIKELDRLVKLNKKVIKGLKTGKF